ncbi:adenosine deaminase [Xylariomycetidae sp. FL0641]|nr:adenosine deaminase [Xylariomycetidae sp. FL0641]
MCQTALHGFLAALPKCEHHLHLEGTLEPELLFALAAKHGIPLPSAATTDPAFASAAALRARYAASFADLADFLRYYYVGTSVLRDAADFEALAYAYFAKAAAQGVRHAEVFFDPQAHAAPLAVLLAGFREAQDRAAADFGISSQLVMCLLKHRPPAEALDVFAQARDDGFFADGALAGIGMDSSEAPFPPPLWADVYDAAREAGVRRTFHAGEEGPAECVSQALDLLGAQRIDHGIRAFLDGDEALVARLAAEKVLLTMCPLSNVRLRCIASLAEFPLRQALQAGVRFSINSDDPAYFGGYILENYCALQEEFDLSVAEWEGIAKGAVLGSWCSEERKGEILGEIEEVVGWWSTNLDEQ